MMNLLPLENILDSTTNIFFKIEEDKILIVVEAEFHQSEIQYNDMLSFSTKISKKTLTSEIITIDNPDVSDKTVIINTALDVLVDKFKTVKIASKEELKKIKKLEKMKHRMYVFQVFGSMNSAIEDIKKKQI